MSNLIFNKIYREIQARLKDSLLSLWATGDAQFQNYLEELLDKEKLLAEPVFQNTFPWTPAAKTFGELTHLFDNNLIQSLDRIKGEYEFPKNRKPYIHQIASWEKLLVDKKSIAVTTGTGSGKTECFMLPVLQDLYQNCKDETGVRAIFLYPLNALIGSQKKRIDTWVKAIGGLNYAVYNGNTDDNATSSKSNKALPELISRKQIRDTPPQILFTNPSMLEYLLVRDKDVPLLENSKGKLRWILLDEAHTLVGSAATEMALLIRRVVDAFQVDVKDIRFAITSATVGSGTESDIKLKDFMANLCGIDSNQIEVITGARQLIELPHDLEMKDKSAIKQLRSKVFTSSANTLSELSNGFVGPDKSTEEKLDWLDHIVEIKDHDENSILPLRMHLFSRGIGGVYACSNPKCDKHHNFENISYMGNLTTYAEKTCSKCEFPMFEMVACRSCGNELLKADKQINRHGAETLQMSTSINHDSFVLDDIDNDDDFEDTLPTVSFFFTRKNINKRFVVGVNDFGLDRTGKIDRSGSEFVEADNNNGECVCPHCATKLENPLHFRISSSFMNRILSDVFLENTPPAGEIRQDTLWNGHKYISFTDSRQGTAKISALINIDNESNWIRSQVFHKLSLENSVDVSPDPIRSFLEEQIKNSSNSVIKREFERQLATLPILQRESSRLTWKQIYDFVNPKRDLKILFRNNNPREEDAVNIEKYSRALLFDNFARRLPRERSLENLGMISLVYPDLDNVQVPPIAESYNISLAEWKSLLKIGLDYIIRYKFNFFVDPVLYPYSTSFLRSALIHNQNSNIIGAVEWPRFEKNNLRPSRLALLLCVGLGFSEREEITNEVEEDINNILENIWQKIRSILTEDGNQGYKLNLEEKSRFQLARELWLCPVKKRLIDTQFRGVSPWINGAFTEENIRHYRITNTQPITFPEFKLKKEDNVIQTAKEWITENSVEWKAKGIWNDIHEKIILNRPIYLSGEHSAQQNQKRLKQLEDKFENSEINILNCSTTMEMGVDIGGISTVVMNNVPPGPANYLQRAGRAGRRSESKSLAFTVCASNPVGLNAFNTPTWALTHKIAPPFISFNSQQVVERHVNAFFLGKFVQTEQVAGIRVTEKINDFFFAEINPMSSRFISWLLNDEPSLLSSNLKSIIKNTNFSGRNFNFIINKVLSNFNRILHFTQARKNGFEKKLEEFESEFGVNSPAYKAVDIQYKQFIEKNALSFLAQEGFLPTAGLPTGIVEFETTNIENLNKRQKKENPSYFITRALTEFAPGNNVVIDGMNYLSSGIILDNNRGSQTTKEIIQLCNNCGYQRIVEVAANQNIDSSCPHCNNQSFRGLIFDEEGSRGSFTEMIQPVGFAVDIYQSPNRKISEASRIQYVDPLLINVKPWEQNSTNLIDIRESEDNGEILYYNVGNGNGFHICLNCGKTGFTLNELENHRRLRGGRDEQNGAICQGNYTSTSIRPNVILGGRFKTNFCEIRIREDDRYSTDEMLLYSLGSVLAKELASYLAVEAAEIDFGIKKYDDYSTIFIFDTTKGGAGYSNKFFLYADEILKIAKTKLECDCAGACTKCLIDRKTQWHLNLLNRNKALDWLNKIDELIIPQEIEKYINPKAILGGIRADIIKVSLINQIEEVWLKVDNEISNWDLENILFLEHLKKQATVNLVYVNKPILSNSQDVMTLIQLSSWAKLWIQKQNVDSDIKTVASIKLEGSEYHSYLVNGEVSLNLDQYWGDTHNGQLYRVDEVDEIEYNPLNLMDYLNTSQIFEVYINPTESISSKNLASILISELNNKCNIKSVMDRKKFKASYYDRYLKTPFGCFLMLQFIDQLKSELNFELQELCFYGQDFSNEREPLKVFHDFRNQDSRKPFIEFYKYDLDLENLEVLIDHIPHYRYFEFTNDEYKIIIRPDAGIEHGWILVNRSTKIEDLNSLNNSIEILKKNSLPILYTISIESLK